MIKKELDKYWKLKKAGSAYIPAKVPGSVYSNYLEQGKMDDPFWRDNELKALKMIDSDYEFKCEFNTDSDILKRKHVLVRFEGIDTISTIFLNGEQIGTTENMFRTYEFDIKELLKKGKNTLAVKISSPTRYIKEENSKLCLDGSADAMKGFPHIRKTHCMFGWDWGPRLPDEGIWKPVYIIAYDEGRLDGIYVHQKHVNKKVNLTVDVDVEEDSGSNLDYQITLTDPSGKEKKIPVNTNNFEVDKPLLWWPNGLGEQPLYTVRVDLINNEKIIDTVYRKIGLRELTVSREKDDHGESFAHEVNGVKFFAMGADYIPEDNIFSRINPQRTRELLKQAKDANFNVIRVWGGGYYPSDYFYDICDELGLVVWQDMMFACAVYELTDEFEDNISKEVEQNVKRLRNHASLGLWCGNNEMEMFMDSGRWNPTPKQKADYIRMYEYIFPKILKKCDPETFYWPASPSSGGGFDYPNDPARGDVHYWDVWHGNKPFTDYRNYSFRYLSEFGFESFPSIKTIESFTLPEDRNVFSYIMEKHQRCNGANGKILNYMSQTYRYSNSFEKTVYASQLLQAEGIKYGVEHFRRLRGICMGAIYWQLNDCWPVASWASIDYYGRWKALHYYAKRFFAPVLLSCCEEGMLSQDPNINAEPYDLKKSIKFNIQNETMKDGNFDVEWSLRNIEDKVKKSGKIRNIKVQSLSSKWLSEIDLKDADIFNDYVFYTLRKNGKVISDGSVIFSLPKYFNYKNPKITYKVEGDEIILNADHYAKSVAIRNKNDDLLVSDNFFDMLPGEKRIKILRGKPDEISIMSVYDID